jgi:mRNA-degrading endonuclease toxin of MazEF toxin-antitoxin module
MIQPKPGEVWWIDLGMKAKFRPMMIVSREDAKAERAQFPRSRRAEDP